MWIKDPDFERSQWFQAFLVEIFAAVSRQLKMDIVTNARSSFDQMIPKTPGLEAIDFDIDLGKVGRLFLFAANFFNTISEFFFVPLPSPKVVRFSYDLFIYVICMCILIR